MTKTKNTLNASLPSNNQNDAPCLTGGRRNDILYQELCRHIKSAVAHAPLASAKKLAELYGVSHSSARRVMERLCREGWVYQVQGKGSFVAETVPSQAVMPTILYADTWMDATHPFKARRIQGMIDAAQEKGMRIQIEPCPDNKIDENSTLVASLQRNEVCALVLPWLPSGVAAYLKQRRERLRVVVTAHDSAPPFGAAVGIDFYDMGYKAAAYLQRKNFQHVTVVSLHQQARRGFESFASQKGWNCQYSVLPQVGNIPGHEELAAAIMAQLPEAIFFDDDLSALAILGILGRAQPAFIQNRHILSHANYGSTPWPCPVTCLTFDGYEVGRAIVHTIQSLLNDSIPGGLTVRLAPTLQHVAEGCGTGAQCEVICP